MSAQLSFPPFTPHPLLRNRHLQTIVGAYLPYKVRGGSPQEHLIKAYDGDGLCIHESRPRSWRSGDRVAVMMHGLGGSHRSPYLVRINDALHEHGYRVFRKELRGFGSSFDKSRGHAHAGRSEDVAATIEQVIDWAPDSPISIVGFSMSANMLLKWLGEAGEQVPSNVDSALAVAPPMDLMQCCVNLRQGVNRLYDWSFVRGLHALVNRRRKAPGDYLDVPIRSLPKRLREFDNVYTAPLCGFSNYREYYTESSAARWLTEIRTPTLILAAEDDPVVPFRMFQEYPRSDQVDLYSTTHGGHLGYVANSRGADPDCRWLDWRVIDWVRSHPRRHGLIKDVLPEATVG